MKLMNQIQINASGQSFASACKITSDYISGLTQTDEFFNCFSKLSKSCIFSIKFFPEFNITTKIRSMHISEQIIK